MRKRTFALPNLVATVRFVGAEQDGEIIVHGLDIATVSERLRHRYPGIQIKSVLSYDFAAKWGKKAKAKKAAVDAAVDAKQKYDFQNNSIWTELKDFLFDLFDSNCAYCECSLLSGSFGAVEHYRPKSPVADSADHPGYYWLAYEVRNYLPTCNRCNTSKSNFFPLADPSVRATKPGGEVIEKPLLLNPYDLDTPTTHLTFVSPASDTKVGPVAKGLTEAGKESVRRLSLNRPDVLTERLKEQQTAMADYCAQRNLGIYPIPVLEQLKAGKRPFSAAALVAVTLIEQGFPSLD